MSSAAEAESFATMVYSFLLNVGRIVLKMAETVLKNSHITAKDI
jgi:hypothetical protein